MRGDPDDDRRASRAGRLTGRHDAAAEIPGGLRATTSATLRLVQGAQGSGCLAGQRLLGEARVRERCWQRPCGRPSVVDRHGRLGGGAGKTGAVGVDANHHTGGGELDRVVRLGRNAGDAADANTCGVDCEPAGMKLLSGEVTTRRRGTQVFWPPSAQSPYWTANAPLGSSEASVIAMP